MRQTVRRAHLSRHAAGVPTAKHPRLTFLVALLAGCGLIGLLGASGATASTLFIDTTPGCSTVTVPGGVGVLHVDAIGTAGMGTAGGAGDEVTADLSGVAGQTLDVCVAQGAGAAGTGTATTGDAGGGASGVGVGVNFSNPLVIGAGGGGGSATNTGGPADLPAGGNGASTDVASGQGGTGGSQGSVGAGGAAEGRGGPGQSVRSCPRLASSAREVAVVAARPELEGAEAAAAMPAAAAAAGPVWLPTEGVEAAAARIIAPERLG